MKAGVKVYRAPDIWVDRNRRYKAVVDDLVVDELWPGQSTLIGIEPGNHTVRVKIDFMRSNELRISLRDGEQVELACRGRGSILALFNTLFRRNACLDLHPVTPDEIEDMRRRESPTLPPPRDLG
jgi:hypothetical protein